MAVVTAGMLTLATASAQAAGETWTSAAQPPVAIEGAAGAWINGRLFVTHGNLKGPDPLTDEWLQGDTNRANVYNPATNAWTRLADAGIARAELSAAVVDGKMYVIGGRGTDPTYCAAYVIPDGPGVCNAVEVYDPATDAWSMGAPMPTPRAGLGVVALGGLIYAIGGRTTTSATSAGALDTVEVYDPATNLWSSGPPLPEPRSDLYAVAALGGKIYVAGGDATTQYLDLKKDLFVFDPTSGWTRGPDMPTARSNAIAGVCGSSLYVAGGIVLVNRVTGERAFTNAVERFDPVSQMWSTAASMPAGVAEMAAGLVGSGTALMSVGAGIFGQASPQSMIMTCSSSGGPVVTPADASVQYSDPIASFTVSATDPENKPLTLSATGLPPSLSFTDNQDGTGTISGTASATPATYPVTYSATNGTNPAATATGTVTVTREDCTLTSPSTIVSNASGTTPLTTTMGEPDTSLGDRSNKVITFTGVDSSMSELPPLTATTDASGNASAPAALGPDVYSINAQFAGDAFYNSCSTMSDTIVTVSPAAFKVTGGGWVANGIGQTSFGFNAMSDVTGLHGQIQVRTPKKGKFHGNVVLSLSGAENTAQWSGTGRWNGNPGYYFSVAVVDAGTSGKKGDTISIIIKNPANTATVFSTSGSLPLKGGNIVVH